MSHLHRFAAGFGLAALLYCPFAVAAKAPTDQPYSPHAVSVQRSGPAYRYPQAGWIVLHIEGEPYDRGYQHGQLLAPEIADYIRALANGRSQKAPADGWRDLRLLVNAIFLRSYDREYLEEMKGIADGAAAAGAKFHNRPIDLIDIVAINSGIEVDFLDANLEATPTGLEGLRFKEPPYAKPKAMPPAHCSAFAATGPATADGKIVFGHITMFNLYNVRHFNVWLDVKPTKGHRVLMQTFPGGIMSGMDYYMNDAGLLVAETTIGQTKFDLSGKSLVSRIRQALQYSDSIDDAVRILREKNNGVYSNEWLLGDIKTNEVAMLELGTQKSKLWRSSKNEWIGGTPGFYWGCNNEKDLAVRLETIASVESKPANVVFRPSERDIKWIQLYEKHQGKITADFGFEAFTTHPIALPPSCDAKFTTSALAKELKSWALFGPPYGRVWEPADEERRRFPDIQALVPNDWTLLHARAPTTTEALIAADISSSRKERKSTDEDEELLRWREWGNLPPAWHGTILPKTDADTWLAAAFADYEKVVALEKSISAKAGPRTLTEEEADRLSLSVFPARSRYLTAVRRLGNDMPLSQIRLDMRRDEWYDIAAGKGTLLLADLRKSLGAERFDKTMDEFGRANAGKEVTTSQFREHAERAHGKPLDAFFDSWLNGNGSTWPSGNGCWSVNSFLKEPERTLIVYGTQKDVQLQRQAAERLQQNIRAAKNFVIPMRSDTEIVDSEQKNNHLLVVGRPDSNLIAAKSGDALPLTFEPGAFNLRTKTYANPASAVIAAGSNPFNPRYSFVVFAGLGAESTWRAVQHARGRPWAFQLAEVVLFQSGSMPRPLAVSTSGAGKNGRAGAAKR